MNNIMSHVISRSYFKNAEISIKHDVWISKQNVTKSSCVSSLATFG